MGLAVSKNFAPIPDKVAPVSSDDEKKTIVPGSTIPDQKQGDSDNLNSAVMTGVMIALFASACGCGYFMVRRRRLR